MNVARKRRCATDGRGRRVQVVDVGWQHALERGAEGRGEGGGLRVVEDEVVVVTKPRAGTEVEAARLRQSPRVEQLALGSRRWQEPQQGVAQGAREGTLPLPDRAQPAGRHHQGVGARAAADLVGAQACLQRSGSVQLLAEHERVLDGLASGILRWPR